MGGIGGGAVEGNKGCEIITIVVFEGECVEVVSVVVVEGDCVEVVSVVVVEGDCVEIVSFGVIEEWLIVSSISRLIIVFCDQYQCYQKGSQISLIWHAGIKAFPNAEVFVFDTTHSCCNEFDSTCPRLSNPSQSKDPETPVTPPNCWSCSQDTAWSTAVKRACIA